MIYNEIQKYSLSLVTGPAIYPVSLPEAKNFLNVDDTFTDNDAFIAALIASCTATAENFLRRALITQTWDMFMDGFPSSSAYDITMPKAPLQSVTSITYTDTNGTSQTWASSKYTVDTKSEPGRVLPAYSEVYPSTRDHVNVVTVRFVAGYGSNASDVPEPIRHGILLMMSHWYDRREEVVIGATISKMPMASENLMMSYRIFGF